MNGQAESQKMSECAPSAKVLIGIDQKRCTRCGQIKFLNEFYRNKTKKDGYNSWCKRCYRIRDREYYENNSEKIKERSLEWARKNPDKVREYNHKRYIHHKEEQRECSREWARKNPEKCKKAHRKYYKENREKFREYNCRSKKKRYSTSKGKLSVTISNGMRKSLNRNSKNNQHWENLVGYTVGDLKAHLEKKFSPGMSWENYGKWHIDHKIPIAAHNYKTPEDIDFKKCWALKNLQPMWATENIKKFNKLDRPFQPSLSFAA